MTGCGLEIRPPRHLAAQDRNSTQVGWFSQPSQKVRQKTVTLTLPVRRDRSQAQEDGTTKAR